ncbi:MAG: multidrug ABC transporter permease [Synechococcales cyanobacterium CRU_2_2]|nr:multidrug ABC transporter permease [Synechococcales cyanobacterium CRU_2_2]
MRYLKGSNRVWQVARSLLSVYYAYMVEYRAELMFWVLSGSLPLILLGVWTQASEGGQFALSSIEFARYFLAVFITRQFTVVWVIWDFEKEVVEGTLSFRLLQPLDPGWHHFSTHFAERGARLPFIFVLVGLFAWLYPQAIWMPELWRLGFYCITLLVAFSLRFLAQYTFAMFAFWIERATAIEQFWFLFYLFLSGMVAPLNVFPEGIAQAVLWTPFPYLIYFPVAILLGLQINLLQGYCIMLGWFALFWLANRWLWKQGLKRYSGMGA